MEDIEDLFTEEETEVILSVRPRADRIIWHYYEKKKSFTVKSGYKVAREFSQRATHALVELLLAFGVWCGMLGSSGAAQSQSFCLAISLRHSSY